MSTRVRTGRRSPRPGQYGARRRHWLRRGKFVPDQNYHVDKMAETGLYADGKKGVRRPGDPGQRIKDMDRDGVDAEIIFGILGALRTRAKHRP